MEPSPGPVTYRCPVTGWLLSRRAWTDLEITVLTVGLLENWTVSCSKGLIGPSQSHGGENVEFEKVRAPLEEAWEAPLPTGCCSNLEGCVSRAGVPTGWGLVGWVRGVGLSPTCYRSERGDC